MKLDDPATGMTLMCDDNGVVLEVVHNGLDVAAAEVLGKPFPMLAATTSFPKAPSFLVELRARRTAFDWELDLSVGASTFLAHCGGLVFEDRLLILVARTRTEVHRLFEDMIHINNDHTNLVRALTKDQVALGSARQEREIGHYEALSRLNNDLVNLQRELTKKHVELERLNAEVQRLSIMDELTQIYNRRGFFEMGHREVERARRFGTSLAAIMIDADHFKKLNDTYGHATGDLVLREIARRCSEQLRKVDVLGRYGGEEFAVLLPQAGVDSASRTAERLRHHITAAPIACDHSDLTVTVSLGVAVLVGAGMDLDALLARADQNLYKAKAAGRNRAFVA